MAQGSGLILTRRFGESILINGELLIEVQKGRGKCVKLRIQSLGTREYTVHRPDWSGAKKTNGGEKDA